MIRDGIVYVMRTARSKKTDAVPQESEKAQNAIRQGTEHPNLA